MAGKDVNYRHPPSRKDRADDSEQPGVEDRDVIAQCFARIAAQDAGGLRDLIALTQPRIRAIALRLLGDGAEVDEVVQDVYLTAWDKAARYDAGRAHGTAWLTVIVRNRCLDRLRARTVRRVASSDPSDVLIVNGWQEDETERNNRLERLSMSLETLDPDTRHAIKAAFFDGHTYEALARSHNVPVGTMKSRIRRGLLALRSVLRS